jgi:hypothetical protein
MSQAAARFPESPRGYQAPANRLGWGRNGGNSNARSKHVARDPIPDWSESQQSRHGNHGAAGVGAAGEGAVAADAAGDGAALAETLAAGAAVQPSSRAFSSRQRAI